MGLKRPARHWQGRGGEKSFPWLAAQRAANGNEFGGIFPWTGDPSDDNHHGMANLGQLKAVFFLHFTRDTDEDGLPDLIEHILGTKREWDKAEEWLSTRPNGDN